MLVSRYRIRYQSAGSADNKDKAMSRALMAALMLCLICASFASVAQSVIRVPQHHSTIQAAINAAANGDTVLVAPGMYTENIDFNGKAITVRSERGANVTVIAGGAADSVVTFANGESLSSILTGFTVRKSRAIGISIDGASPLIKENIIFDDSGCEAVGIVIRSASPVIQRNVIHGNGPWRCPGIRGGGGIAVGSESSPQILDNVIVGNMAGDEGGGINLATAKTVLIKGNVIFGNKAGECCGPGGGIAVSNMPTPSLSGSNYQSDTSIIQNLIFGNSASEGGGVYWHVPPDTQGPLLVNNTIADNDGRPFSPFNYGNPPRLVNNIIVGKPNQAPIDCSGISLDHNTVYSPACNNVAGTAGNISADPLFVNPTLGDYRLRANSPAIDRGSNAAPGLPTVDLDGNARRRDGDGNGVATVDMGAYEFSSGTQRLTLTSGGSDFGTLLPGSGQVSRTVTISNAGPVSVAVIMSAVASNDPAAFALATGGPAACASLSPTLGPGTSCTVVVSFTPAAAGTKTALLVVVADTAGSPAITPFSATALQTDTMPDSLVFFPQFAVARGSAVVSNSATVTGIAVPVAISIAGGEYSIDGGAFTANPGTIQNGQNVVVRLIASTSYETFSSATLAVGATSANFSVQTLAPIFTGSPPIFLVQTAVPGSTVVSNSIGVTGIDIPIPLSITGGEYSISGGAFTASPGSISNGQTVAVRVIAPTTFNAQTNALLFIGARPFGFTVSTPAQTSPPSPTYFPLALGQSRTVRRNGVVGSAATITDARILDGVVTFGVPDTFDGSSAYFSNDGLLGARLHRIVFPPSLIPGCGTASETDRYNPPVTIIPATIVIGQTISSSGTVTADAGACGAVAFTYNASSALETIERVSVPAGQFDALRVRLTLSVAGASSTDTTLWLASGIGEVKVLNGDGTVDELVSTDIVRTTPDGFVFAAQTNVPLSSRVISNPVIISGISSFAAVSITGGEYSIDGRTFTSQPGTVTNGQTIRVRLTSAPRGATSTSVTLTVGGVTGTFTVTTGLGGPTAPTGVTVRAGLGSITVGFGAPPYNGGAAVTGYTATCTSSNGGASGSNTGAANATSIQVTGLTVGKRYTCTVAASNAAGTGTASEPTNPITPFDLTPILNLLLGE